MEKDTTLNDFTETLRENFGQNATKKYKVP